MSSRSNVTVNYDVQVRLDGLGLVLMAMFGGGRSVHDVLVGGNGPWGPNAQLEPWLEMEPSPVAGLLGGVGSWGEEVEIDWE